jgi:predicted Zn-dependent protease
MPRPPVSRRWLALAAALALLTVTGCATNPATGKKEISFISRGQEIEIGREEDRKIVAQYGTTSDTALAGYVDRIGQKLATHSELPNLEWHFRLLDSPVVNAFALPGGYIYITRGILAALNSEAQLAGVVGHEIGHVTARHTAQRITQSQLAGAGILAGMILSPDIARYGDALQQSAGLLLLKFGRDDENQADALGIRYMVRAGYDPREVPATYDMLGRLGQRSGGGLPTFLSTHPDPGDRKARTSTMSNEAVLGDPGRTWLVEEDDFKKRIDGMIYGEDPEAGYLVGNVFYHPGLNIEITWPNGWQVQNNAASVVAASPDGAAAIQLTMENTGDGPGDPEAYVNHLRQKGELAQASGQVRTIHGQKAWIGRVVPANGNTPLALAFVAKADKQLYQFLGTPGATDAAGRFGLTVESLGPIRDPARRTAKPNRVDLVVAPGGKTLDEIFAAEKDLALPLDELAWLNNRYGKDVPPKGTLIKVVRRG